MNKCLVNSGQDWTFDNIYDVWNEIETVANDLKYNIYTNQVEIISSAQMLDNYSSVAMPLMYKHWSFGKNYLRDKKNYEANRMGLAYEIVINSDPCVVYIMENNDLLMQTLVLAHAGVGHNHFFKNNYMFKQWTEAKGIIDYLAFAKTFIEKCEEKYGIIEVEKILDASHALMAQGVDKYPRKEPLSFKQEMQRKIDKALDAEASYNDIWRVGKKKNVISNNEIKKQIFHLPEENLLFFLEKYSPNLKQWQREVIRIVRNIAQYFYPQSQDMVMNEGCATYTHYTILNKLHEKGIISDGAMLGFFHSHCAVTFQPYFDDPRYSGINVYALGFAMMQDIERICKTPTEEDKKWFPAFAGCNDHMNVLFDAWANYRDESFIKQFLSPEVMRKFKMFSITDQQEDHYLVKNIHNEIGYKQLRHDLSQQYEHGYRTPEIEVADVDMQGDRTLTLEYTMFDERLLDKKDLKAVLKMIANLWGYHVRLRIMQKNGNLYSQYDEGPDNSVKNYEPDYFTF